MLRSDDNYINLLPFLATATAIEGFFIGGERVSEICDMINYNYVWFAWCFYLGIRLELTKQKLKKIPTKTGEQHAEV